MSSVKPDKKKRKIEDYSDETTLDSRNDNCPSREIPLNSDEHKMLLNMHINGSLWREKLNNRFKARFPEIIRVEWSIVSADVTIIVPHISDGRYAELSDWMTQEAEREHFCYWIGVD